MKLLVLLAMLAVMCQSGMAQKRKPCAGGGTYYACGQTYKGKGPVLKLKCPKAYPRISVISAVYGRPKTMLKNCAKIFTPKHACEFPSATTFVQGMCNGKSFCNILVNSPYPFPVVCPRNKPNYYYLAVNYTCCRHGYAPRCRKLVKRVRPKIRGCIPRIPLYQARCFGFCPSRDFISIVTRKQSRLCFCCKAVPSKRVSVVRLPCIGKKPRYIYHRYRDTESCRCLPCKP